MASRALLVASIIGSVLVCNGADLPEKYNLIDATPSCIERGLCPHLSIGGPNSIHPNVKERMEYLFRNMARAYPPEYLETPYGAHYVGTYGTTTYYACNATARKYPFYWLSEANQVTRAHQYWNSHCECGCSYPSHDTCPDYCDLMRLIEWRTTNRCGYVTRTYNFVTDWGLGSVGSEGIWDFNMGFTSSGHCGMPFNKGYNHMGIGYWPGAGMTMVGVYNSPVDDHVFPHGVHFDERIRINADDYETNGNYLTFMTQFFGGKKDPEVTASVVYLLYDGQAQVMDTYLGDTSNGFYRLRLGTAGLERCRPYAFVAVDTDGNFWRLPEDDNYFFGTYNDPTEEFPSICAENHYYWNGEEWQPNASPKVEGDSSSCVGCSEIDDLVTIWKEFLGPTPGPTAAPTLAPSGQEMGYILETDTMTWDDANAACYDRYGSELATIYDDQSARILLELAGTSSVWIGLNDYESEGRWVHADGDECSGYSSNCINLPYWISGEPNNQWNDQHAGYIEGATADGNIYSMLADTRGYYNNFRFICNPERTKSPTPATGAPTTATPTQPTSAPTQAGDCGDYQCVTVSGLDGFNGAWTANGNNCIYDKSIYTNDAYPGVYLCLNWAYWTFTTNVDVANNYCDTSSPNRLAYCTKKRSNMAYCSASSAWQVYDDETEAFGLISSQVSLQLSYSASCADSFEADVEEDAASNAGKNSTWIAVGICVALAVIVVVGAGFYCLHRKKKRAVVHVNDHDEDEQDGMNQGTRKATYDMAPINTEDQDGAGNGAEENAEIEVDVQVEDE